MKYNLISNITNGAGLQKDTELLCKILQGLGHTVTCTMFNHPAPTYRPHDVNIFLEVVATGWVRHAPQNWLIPNSEWWFQGWDCILPHVNKVLCKTHDCEQIWSKKVGAHRTKYIGFEARDFYRKDINKEPRFLHLAGKSETKNTAAVMQAWRKFGLPYKLTVSAFKPEIIRMTQGVQNVRQVNRFDDAEAIFEMNRCMFHVMPSKYEGYGHAIHEALGCKGIVITTDAPPMNEFAGIDHSLCVPVLRKTPRPPLCFFYEVNPDAIAQQVVRVAKMGQEELAAIGERARAGFFEDRAFFQNAIKELFT